MTDPATIEATLDLLTPDEVRECLRFVDVLERSQHMSEDEAAEWRRRVAARRAFLKLEDDTQPSG